MNSIELKRSGVAVMPVAVATLSDTTGEASSLGGVSMRTLQFLVDTGATRTTIPKKTLKDRLGFTEEWIQRNKVLMSEKDRPILADKTRADAYKIPITRINISGHEIQHDDYILTSDTVEFNLLLGLDILSYFKFTFDFDAKDAYARHGRMFYEFRESRKAFFVKLEEPFAYQLGESQD